MDDCDVLIVGAGHNALICAGYLAQAGYSVIILKRRHTVGGAVVTEEIIRGFKFDLGGSAHILINQTPVVQDLDLAAYGLDYIDVDPLFVCPFPDGSHFTIWKDLDRTCESIAQIAPQDADNYRTFVQRWEPLARGMVASFQAPPTAGNLYRNLVRNTAGGDERWERLSDILHGYGQVLTQSFVDPRIQAAIAWMAAQSGPPPSEPLSAPFALWQPMYHHSGMKRPRGGSGMLTQALARMIQAHGGQIIAGAPVKRILTRNGKAIGAETEGGMRVTASRAVVSGAHIQTTLCMLEDAPLPDGWLGKPWACHQLAQAAQGELLLFTDADVVWLHDAVAAAVALLQSEGAGLLSVWPTQQIETWAERLVVPLMSFALLAYLSVDWAHNLPHRQAAAAIGQCLLFSKAGYAACGGHAAVRDRVLEDVVLAQRVKGAGLPRARMYTGWRSVRDGYAENILAGHLNSIPLLLLSTIFHCTLFVLPWLWLLARLWSGHAGLRSGWPLLPLAAVLLGVSQRACTAATAGQPLRDALLMPISVLLMTRIALQAIWWCMRYGGPIWKGRTLPAQ